MDEELSNFCLSSLLAFGLYCFCNRSHVIIVHSSHTLYPPRRVYFLLLCYTFKEATFCPSILSFFLLTNSLYPLLSLSFFFIIYLFIYFLHFNRCLVWIVCSLFSQALYFTYLAIWNVCLSPPPNWCTFLKCRPSSPLPELQTISPLVHLYRSLFFYRLL